MTTQSDLVYDVNDNLKEYYEKRAELEKQIEIFREAIETAQDDLKKLDKEHKTQLRIAGKKKEPMVEIIYNYVKENPGLTRVALNKALEILTHNQKGTIATYITRSLDKGNIVIVENRCYVGVLNKRATWGSLKRQIFDYLEKHGPSSAVEVAEYIKTDRSTISITMGTYVSKGQLEVIPKTSGEFIKYRVVPSNPNKVISDDMRSV